MFELLYDASHDLVDPAWNKYMLAELDKMQVKNRKPVCEIVYTWWQPAADFKLHESVDAVGYMFAENAPAWMYKFNKPVVLTEIAFRNMTDKYIRKYAWQHMFSGGGGFFNMDFKASIKEPVSINTTWPRPMFGGGAKNRMQMSSLAKYFKQLDFHLMHPDTSAIKSQSQLFAVHTLAQPDNMYASYISVVPGTNKYRLEYSGYLMPHEDVAQPLVIQGYHSNSQFFLDGKKVLDYGERKSYRRDTVDIHLRRDIAIPFLLISTFDNDEGSVRLNIADDYKKGEIPLSWFLDEHKVQGQLTAKYFKTGNCIDYPDVVRTEPSIHHQVSEPSPFVTEEDVRVTVLEAKLPKGNYSIKWINPELNAVIIEEELEITNELTLIKTPYFIFDVVMEIRKKI